MRITNKHRVEVMLATHKHLLKMAEYEDETGRPVEAKSSRREAWAYWFAAQMITDPEYLRKSAAIHKVEVPA